MDDAEGEAEAKKEMREAVLDELRFSCAVVLAREEVVPRFRVLTPDGSGCSLCRCGLLDEF